MPASSRRIAAAMLVLLVAASVLACDLFDRQDPAATGTLIVDPGPNASGQDIEVAGDAALRYAELGRSRPIAVAVIDRLGLDEDPAGLVERISATGSREDLTIRLDVSDDDPEAARDLVLALGDAMIEHVEAEFAASEPVTPQQALQRDIEDRFADLVEPIDPPMIVRHRLVWFEKPPRVPAD